MKTNFLFSRLALGALLSSLFTACPKVPDPDPLEAAPSITVFTASASTVPVGTGVKLTWNVENATSVKIDELKLGSVSGVSGNSGEVEVAITDDSLFVLTARNARGAADTAVVSVRAGAASREVLFTALPESIVAGSAATLAWSAPGATDVTITAAGGGALNLGGQTTNGALIVTPAVTTTYTLAAGGRTATATVTVQPTLISFTATPMSADAGAEITLRWTTASANRVQLTAPGRAQLVDETDAALVASGSFTDTLPAQIEPGQLFPYLLTVTGGGQTLTSSVVISIAGTPAVETLTAPAFVRAPSAGALADGGVAATEFTLAWTTREATSVSLSAGGVELYRAPAPAVVSGNVRLPVPAQTTTYVLTARDSRGGVATRSATVEVRGLPTVALTATPGSVTGGTPVTLSWTGQNIFNAAIRESAFGGVIYASSTAANTGTTRAAPNGDVTYTFVADNGLGDVTTATAAVTVTSPLTLTVADTGALRSGQNVTVSWTSPGGPVPIIGLGHEGVDVRTTSTGFEDISTTGTKLTLSSSKASITTGFRTALFGRDVGSVITVSQHGYLTFGPLNGSNSTDVALPTSRLEPMSIAPYWESLTVGGGIFWQVKQIAGSPTLIVQWQMTTAEFEAKIAATGQVDFEYRTVPSTVAGRAGVAGARPAQTVVLPVTPAAYLGATFFGSRPSPVTVRAVVEGPLTGSLDLGAGTLLRVGTSLPLIVNPSELSINEVMAASTVGVPGTWVELRNARDLPVPLAGWSFSLADGGAIPLSGSVPARGLLVVGASTDPAVNDDAGVQRALPNFDFTGQPAVTLARDGAHDSVSLAGADAGIAFTHDLGPYLYSGSTPAGAARCTTTATYGGAAQRGTPGTDFGCDFGYALASMASGYFDISDGGTPLLTTGFDSSLVTVNVTSAPIPFFGIPRSSAVVSTNGFVTFDAASTTSTDELGVVPSPSDGNLLVAAFASDLTATSGTGQLYSKRVGASEDPFATAPHWIFQWHRYRVFGGSDDLNFQLKFFDDGTIEVHFGSMLSGSSSQYGAGTDTSTWLENASGTQALTINAVSATPGVLPFSAFRFVPR